jgi:hypothetical protein
MGLVELKAAKRWDLCLVKLEIGSDNELRCLQGMRGMLCCISQGLRGRESAELLCRFHVFLSSISSREALVELNQFQFPLRKHLCSPSSRELLSKMVAYRSVLHVGEIGCVVGLNRPGFPRH